MMQGRTFVLVQSPSLFSDLCYEVCLLLCVDLETVRTGGGY